MRLRLILLMGLAATVVVLVFGGATWAHFNPKFELTVVGYTTNQATPEIAALLRQPYYVCAVIAATNHHRSGITYPLTQNLLTDYLILHRFRSRWMDLASERPDFPTEAWLPPGGNTFFEAFVDTQVPCRIALDYRVESEVGRRLS